MRSTEIGKSYNLVAIIACLIGSAFLAFPVWAIERKTEFYVVNVKPPSVSVIEAASMKVAAAVPLEAEPSYAIMGPKNKHLYVLLEGILRANGNLKLAQSKLAVVDVEARKQLKTIPLAWNTRGLSLTRDGRHLVAVNLGKATSKKQLPEENGSVIIIDTQTNELVATLSAGRLGMQVVYNSDLSRLAILSHGEQPKKKGKPYKKPMVTIFTLEEEKPLAEIELERAKEMTLSADEKLLYVLDPGNASKKAAEHKNGSVQVIDLADARLLKAHDVGTLPRDVTLDPETGSLVVLSQVSTKDRSGKMFHFRGAELAQTADIGEDPQFVKPFGSKTGAFVITAQEMRLLPATGDLSSSFVALNPKKGAPQAPAGAQARYLGGVPGEILHVPQYNKLVTTVRTPAGAPTSKIAIIDLAGNTVEHVITTGRGGVKFGKFMGAMALSVAMSSVSYYAGYSMAMATGSPYFFYDVYVFTPAPPNLNLTSSPDGRYVYTLNTYSNDVTIVDVTDGKVIDKIAVGGGCRRVALAPAGKYVYSYTGGQVNLIDTTTNKKHLEHKLTSGRVNALHVMAAEKRIVALTSDSLLVWDAETGSMLHKVDKLHQPYILVEQRAEN